MSVLSLILHKGRKFFFNNSIYLVEFSIDRNFASQTERNNNVFNKPNDQREFTHFGMARKGRMKFKQIKTYDYGKKQTSS